MFKNEKYSSFLNIFIIRSLSSKNWQDRDKADKVSISFPETPKDN